METLPSSVSAGAGTMYVPVWSWTIPPVSGSAEIAALIAARSVAPVASPDGAETQTTLVVSLPALLVALAAS